MKQNNAGEVELKMRKDAIDVTELLKGLPRPFDSHTAHGRALSSLEQMADYVMVLTARPPAEPTAWVRVDGPENLPKVGEEFIVAYDPEDGESTRIIESVAEYCGKSYGKREAGKWYYIGSEALEFPSIIAYMPISPYTEPEDSDAEK